MSGEYTVKHLPYIALTSYSPCALADGVILKQQRTFTCKNRFQIKIERAYTREMYHSK